MNTRAVLLFALVALLFVATGVFQSWNLALTIFNMGLISAIMALGVNIQWGYAGLFNVGVMGFVALGGLGAVLVSMPPNFEAVSAGGGRIVLGLLAGVAVVAAAIYAWRRGGRYHGWITAAVLLVGFFVFRAILDPGVIAVEAVNPASAGNIGGLNFCADYRDCGWITLLSWPAGAVLAAGAAWIIGKTALGLRSDYLAIATLGIAEIIIAVMKNEDWLARGVKNVIGLPRPVPYEIDLQNSEVFTEAATEFGFDPVTASTIAVKLAYAGFFALVLLLLIWLTQAALTSPWGRMMRAIRDNEVAAEAMGKDVTARHLQIFVLGSAVLGLAGAMMITFDGQLTPTSYQPLRYTFLIWVMVIVGGSGNNWGSVLGGFLIWWLWVQVEYFGPLGMTYLTAGMPDGFWLKDHLQEAAQHTRLALMGVVLLLVLRFSPKGLLPER
ncbi:branched-chain amino acid ABC transporter permease [Jannaschia sp. S6380]|uniref:branched-chain amino acid ABC transporter permease n=1 Tax=Jannaschia sp. S6380 TaxID=2926408 RepID=UPI001FF48CA5|nr:branched-chain amino acid ABC transporter permease [Jannaschia sp. S6380]MCK0166931.1 branched-chain amino acid ABC transporter permease [Jannaschia sp. S6380]